MGFESIINNITSYFQDVADVYNLIVRYDNDFRDTPTDNIWCKCNIDFDDSKQKEIGIASFRNFGNFIIEIYSSIKIGNSYTLSIIDILVSKFTELTIDDIKFKTPSVRNIGKMKDDYQINVICPFYVDN